MPGCQTQPGASLCLFCRMICSIVAGDLQRPRRWYEVEAEDGRVDSEAESDYKEKRYMIADVGRIVRSRLKCRHLLLFFVLKNTPVLQARSALVFINERD